MTPHRPEPQTSKDRDWATGIWNPTKCRHCDLRLSHPIHNKKYIKNPELYKLEHPNK